jgi:hypothetical protein
VEEWVDLDRIASQCIIKNRPVPIIDPAFQYSSIPTFQQASSTLLLDWAMRTYLVPACPE